MAQVKGKTKKSKATRRTRRPVRPGTKRAKVVALCSRKEGASIDALMRSTHWDRKTLMDGIRLVEIDRGFPVKRVEDRFFIRA